MGEFLVLLLALSWSSQHSIAYTLHPSNLTGIKLTDLIEIAPTSEGMLMMRPAFDGKNVLLIHGTSDQFRQSGWFVQYSVLTKGSLSVLERWLTNPHSQNTITFHSPKSIIMLTVPKRGRLYEHDWDQTTNQWCKFSGNCRNSCNWCTNIHISGKLKHTHQSGRKKCEFPAIWCMGTCISHC